MLTYNQQLYKRQQFVFYRDRGMTVSDSAKWADIGIHLARMIDDRHNKLGRGCCTICKEEFETTVSRTKVCRACRRTFAPEEIHNIRRIIGDRPRKSRAKIRHCVSCEIRLDSPYAGEVKDGRCESCRDYEM